MHTSRLQPATRHLTFGDLPIVYDDRVLAPRPWTTAQSLWAAELSDLAPPGRLLEWCAGAGHIGLFALNSTGRSGVLVDSDPAACEFAAGNAAVAGLTERVEVRQLTIEGCLDEGEEFALVIADPPWVKSVHTGRFPEDPLLAIDGGEDGLTLARACLRTVDRCLHRDGVAVLQVGSMAQADELGDWMASEVDLVASEVRDFGRCGVLVLLRRVD